MCKRALIISLFIGIIAACSPSGQIQRAIQRGAALTQIAAPTATPSPTPPPTQTPTIIPSPTNTLAPTNTATPKPSPTLPPTITPTGEPTTTPTASITPTPTNTPVLPPLSGLTLTVEDLNTFAEIWSPPGKRLLLAYEEKTKVNCEIDCAGFQVESIDNLSTLTFILYRVQDPTAARNAAFGGQTLYTSAGYQSISLAQPLGSVQYSWVGKNAEREYVLLAAQGPVVLTIFWQSHLPIDEIVVQDLFFKYAQNQVERLKSNRYTD